MTTEQISPAPQTPVPWIPSVDSFSSRLALVRHRMGWNIKEAARECGVPPASWRFWEVDGGQPRNIITIAMGIAGRTGCDYLWLVHGPNRGGATLSSRKSDVRVVAIGGMEHPGRSSDVVHTRPVRQTRPTGAVTRRPHTAMAL
jgi:hypothetical protein